MRIEIGVSLLAVVVTAWGCGRTSTMEASTAPPVVATSEEPAAADASRLAATLAVEPLVRERIVAATRRAWRDLEAELRERAANLGALDRDTVSRCIARRQRALDGEIAASLTREQRRAFEALGGRLGAEVR